ncbi:glycosyltransferase [Celerinatantimonas sp. MCCC 1A17872]|uniref:glycosyltransferase n=1 Tax=Celerinatantimonas sp. MCCC 1A17872 TaxID=3177514 RepID=UPI0038C20FF1
MHQRLEGGRELTVGPKQGTDEHPLITIITSTFNAANDLHWTIDSIRAQTYPNIQWIVVDGGSRDNTVYILKANEDIIDYWFSEPDNGIYDAWNKALEYSKGEWIQFLGAGDELAYSETMSRVSRYLSNAFPRYELVYGTIDIISEERRQLLEHIGKPWNEMKNRWQGIRPALPVHPEVFHHRCIFSDLDFKQYKVVGDSFIMLKSIQRKNPLFIDLLIDRMPHGGTSTKPENVYLIYREMKKINQLLNINPPLLNRLIFKFKVYIKYVILRFLGYNAFIFLGDLFRFLTFKKRKWMIK